MDGWSRGDKMQSNTAEVADSKQGFLQGVKDCMPTILGYLSIGFAAGVVEKTAGLTIVEIALLSILLYAGSAQFIFAGMLSAGNSMTSIILTIFFVNLRHLLLSAAISPYFRHLSVFKNMLVGALLTDETFGVTMNRIANTQRLSEKWMHGLNIAAYINWIAANIAGAFFGQWIQNPEQFGLDFALPAMFIGLLVLQMLSRRKVAVDLIVAVSAAVIVVGMSLVSSSSLSIIIATVLGATVGMVIEKWK
jgi:4-azaleucine resistance transporter AzlC